MVAKLLAVAVVLVLASGCATTGAAQRTLTDEWMDEARAEGLVLEQPLRLSPQTAPWCGRRWATPAPRSPAS